MPDRKGEYKSLWGIMKNLNDKSAFLPWKPEIFNLHKNQEREQFNALQTSNAVWKIDDSIDQQLKDLVSTRNPLYYSGP